MELKYRYSESTVRPEEVMYGESTVFLRRNIAPETHMDTEGNEYTIWTYEEAKLSHVDFKEYSDRISAQNAINGVSNASNISKVLDGQANGDNNQLIIMEAIAELYELIANLS